jgi:hypothetical protein
MKIFSYMEPRIEKFKLYGKELDDIRHEQDINKLHSITNHFL